MSNCGFLGLGMAVPEKVMTNQDFEKIVDTTDEWITTRTGIKRRHFCGPDEAASDLATEAARRALADAGVGIDDIDLIICATFTGDHTCPNTACVVQQRLGATNNCAAFDLSSACSGFTYACSTAAAFFRSGMYQRILVIGVEVLSKILDMSDRNTCVLFGDGAGAAVLGPVEDGSGFLGQVMGADGKGAEAIILPGGGSRLPIDQQVIEDRRNYLRMAGPEVFKFATKVCGQALLDALDSTGLGISPAELDLIFPHQANVRILESASKRLKIPLDKFVVNIEEYGNTSAASVPLAMNTAYADGRLKRGSLFGLVAFGGGLTYAASIWRF